MIDPADSSQSFDTLVELVAVRARTQATTDAYHFLGTGDVDGPVERLTYGRLHHEALRIGALLQAAGARGAPVLLLYPPGLEFVTGFFGCLAGGAIAVPAYPPDPSRLERSLPRLRAIVRDSQAGFILTTKMIAQMAQALLPMAPELGAVTWIASDDAAPVSGAPTWQDPGLDGASLAFLQYTSGSTAAPKGVMISHANLLHNSAAIYRLAEHTAASVYVSWLPSYHDMGLIGGIIQPLFGGFPGVLMSPLSFLARPIRWLQAISRFRGTTSPFPNFALDLCVRKVAPAARADLDLHSWRVACNGAEPVRAESLERFSEAFGPCGFRHVAHYPAYGLAEATLIATGGSSVEPPRLLSVVKTELQQDRVVVAGDGVPAQVLVGCGQRLDGHQLAIVDPVTCVRKPEGQVGEVWLQGPSVALGYWSRPEQTRETFGAALADSDEGPFLRTGDLGFLRDGELYLTGRCKDLLILRGLNYYPQDIELTVERSHAGIRAGCVVAFSIDVEGEEQLVIAAEVDARQRPFEPQVIQDALRTAISHDHILRVHAVALLEAGALPKTSSGKLQRAECRRGYQEGALRLAPS